ncbi:MAG: amino acid adenylation domain-containing protein [Bacteroidota bacterium]
MKKKPQDIYELTPLQEGFLYHSINNTDSDAYFVQVSYSLSGSISEAVFSKSLQLLFERHSILRTAFVHEGLKKPYQVVLPDRRGEVVFEDIRHLDAEAQERFLAEFHEADKARNFQLAKDCLMRVAVIQTADQNHQLIWSFHHILFDGWCFSKLAEEFAYIYSCMAEGKNPRLPAAPPYKYFIKWLAQQDKQEAMDFWKDYLKGYQSASSLPTISRRNDSVAYDAAEVPLTLDAFTTKELVALAADSQVSINTLVQCLWGVVLARYNGSRDVAFGRISSMRPKAIRNIDSMVGLFINTLPIRIRYDEQMSFRQLIQRVQKDNLTSEKYNYCSLADIQAQTDLKSDLINHLLVFGNRLSDEGEQNANTKETAGWGVESMDRFEQVNYDFSMHISCGDQIQIFFTYNQNRHQAKLIERLAQQLAQLAQQVLTQTDQAIDQLTILPDEQKTQLLRWAGDFKEYNSCLFHEVIQWWAKSQPEKIAIVEGEERWTYQRLEEEASALAGYLAEEYGLSSQQRVGVFLDRSVWSVCSLLAIWKLGAVYTPIDISYPKKRIEEVSQASRFDLLLTQETLADRLPDLNLPTLEVDRVRSKRSSQAPSFQRVSPKATAYIIQTSGTSGTPKRIPIRHRSISNQIQYHIDFMQLSAQDKVLHFAALHFDSSLVEIGMALMAGGTLVLADANLKSNPQLLTDMLQREQVTTAIFTPAYLQSLDRHPLPGLQNIISTGEAAVLEDSLHYAHDKNIYNGYGPTECCIGATFHKVDATKADDYRQLGNILIGRPFYNAHVFILDDQQALLPQGAEGEICVAGVGVTEGYLDKPELTARKFFPNPYARNGKDRILYRTGDLGRWTESGELEYIGRIDEQVQIRGIRVELEEIRHHILTHPTVKDARVAAVHPAGQNLYLNAYLIPQNETIDQAEMRTHLLQRLPAYMVPAQFVCLEEFPLTSNGKIDFKKLANAHAGNLTSSTIRQAASNEREARMLKIWQEVLGGEEIGMNDNFFDLGGHSLKAMKLISNVYRVFKAKLQLQEIFQHPTPADLMQLLGRQTDSTTTQIPKAATKELYEASPAQKRSWILSQFEGASTVYNVPGAFMLEGKLDRRAFRKALLSILSRHEILRTTFVTDDGELRQRIEAYDPERLQLEYINLSGTDEADDQLNDLIDQEYQQPFDLENGPLFRAKLIRFDRQRHAFLYTLHHIITDGWSMQVFFKELVEGYQLAAQSKPDQRPALAIQHKDYSEWLLKKLKQKDTESARNYWLQHLEGEIPVLDFPTDLPRPDLKTYNGRSIRLDIPKDLYEQLTQFCRQKNLSMFMLLLGAMKSLLARYTQQNDLIIGTVVAGRAYPELQDQIGYYTNTLPLRTQIDSKDSVASFFEKIRKVVLDAFTHQAFPFDDLVELLPLDRNISRSPVFDVLLTHQNAGIFESETPSLGDLSVYPVGSGTFESVRYDMEFIFTEFEDGLIASIGYNADLFVTETIERFSQHFLSWLQALLTQPDAQVNALSFIGETEKKQLLEAFNNTSVPLDDKTFVDLFAEQCEEDPDAIALYYEDEMYTYGELAQRSDQVARLLRDQEALPKGAVVALLCERTDWWLFAFIGILKAGAVYLPIRPDEPAERRQHILSDAEVQLVLTHDQEVELADGPKQIELSDYPWSDLPARTEPLSGPGLRDLAYVLYTSGSTGRPKGVALEHRGLVNHLLAKKEILRVADDSIIAQTASQTFDISIWQALTALIAGGATRIYGQYVVADPFLLAKEVDYDEVDILQMVPSYMAAFLDALEQYNTNISFRHLSYLVLVGEILPPAFVDRWFQQFLFTKVVNHYGPTEASDGVSHHIMKKNKQQASVPIGQPIRNMRIYILDEQKQLCPIGVKGEMYLAGMGVARGYLNQTELDAEAFLPDPFYPGERMYRSKDIGRWTADGVLECYGRTDAQIKIRGHRIELGEIEQALYRLPFIQKAALVLRKNDKGIGYLTGYFTLKAGEEATVAEARKLLSAHLPKFMIPEYLILMDEMPMTSSGKIDRKQLPEPKLVERQVQKKELVEPATQTEADLLKVWQSVLGMTDISTDDNFFEIGGHSFKAIKIQTTFYQQSGVKLTIKDIFTHPDIQSLAAYIDHLSGVASNLEKV